MWPRILRAETSESITAKAEQSTLWISYDQTVTESGAVIEHSGSGFIVSKTGYVLTAYHVIEAWFSQLESERLKHPILARISSFKSSNPVELNPVDWNPIADIALLKLRDPRVYAALPLCFVSTIRHGTPILGYGFPLKHEITPFLGLISNDDGPEARWSANVNFEEGVSGGPVLNFSGRVIGLVKGGYGDVTSIRYITQIIRARTMLQNVGVNDDCSEEVVTDIEALSNQAADQVYEYPGGGYRKIGDLWTEFPPIQYSKAQPVSFVHKEYARDNRYIYLMDQSPERPTTSQTGALLTRLPTIGGEAEWRYAKSGNWQSFNVVRPLKRVNAAPPEERPKDFEGSNRKFERQGEVWIESSKGGDRPVLLHKYKEWASGYDFIYLVDESRPNPNWINADSGRKGELAISVTFVRIPISGGQVTRSYSNPLWWMPDGSDVVAK